MHTLEEALKRKRFALSRNVALYLIDLDRFKLVNDSFGHEAGDQFLIEVANRLNNVVASSDTLARLGGDEFVLVRAGTRSDQDVVHLAQRMLDALEAPIQIGQLALIKARITLADKSSMEIRVDVESEDLLSGERRRTGTAFVTFVALDPATRRPTPVPPLRLETPEDREEHAQALERRRLRLERRLARAAAGA